MPLLYALRDQLGLHGLQYGCGLAPVRCFHGALLWRSLAQLHGAGFNRGRCSGGSNPFDKQLASMSALGTPKNVVQ
jgi:hypothetical protein